MRGNFADHARNLGALKWGERDHAVVRAHAPGRAELRPHCRDNEERRLRATLCQCAHELDRGWVGPLQILECEHDGLRARPGHDQSDEGRQLAPTQLFRRYREDVAARERDIEQRRKQGRGLVRVDLHLPQRAFQIGEALFGGHVSPAKALAAPFGDRVQRGVLQKLRSPPLDPGMRRLPQPRVELVQETRLAEARLANNERELPVARPRALPATQEDAQLLFAADERSQRPDAASPTRPARPHDAIQADRFRRPLKVASALLLGDE